MTADTLLTLMEQAEIDQVPTRYTMSFGFGIALSIEQQGMSLDMEIEMNLDMENISSSETTESYSRSTTTMSMMGMNMEEITETYTVLEDGVMVMYIHSGMMDTWTRTETEEALDEPWKDMSANATYEGVALDEETQMLDGREVYVLHCENIPEMGEGMSDSLGDLEGIDSAEAVFPSVVYVDAQTYQTVMIEVDMTALTDILTQSLAESVLGEMDTESDIKTTMTNVVVSFSYDPVEVPAVPQEAYDYLANAGKHTLTCGETTYTVTLPAGWNGEAMDETSILAYNGDFSMMSNYFYLEGASRDDLVEMVQMDVDSLKESEIYVSHGEGPAIEGYETMEVIGKDVRAYFAWADLGEGYLLVYIMDYGLTDEPAELLQTMVDCVAPAAAE